MQDKNRAIREYQRQFILDDGRLPSLEEANHALGLDVGYIDYILFDFHLSLNKAVGIDGYGEGGDIGELQDVIEDDSLSPYNLLESQDLLDLLWQVTCDCLDERKIDIIKRRFGLNVDLKEQTLEEIGVLYGVSRERIRQLETKALSIIREKLKYLAVDEKTFAEVFSLFDC